MMKRTIIIGIFGVVLAGSAVAHSITGKVVAVVDGDTIRVHVSRHSACATADLCSSVVTNSSLKVRLAEIDALHQRSHGDHDAGQAPASRLVIVRLAEIDAPEVKQAFGQESKAVLESLILNKEVVIDWKKTDRYGRIIGSIYSHKKAQKNTKSVNAELIMRGMAWQYRKYSNDPELAEAESTARENKLGLWQAISPTPPWRYRGNQK